MLGAVLVHPKHREVIPLAPEPIVKGDGCNEERLRAQCSKTLAI